MSITLKPIGNYIYDPDSCSFDEAWKQLEEAYRTKSFVICQAVRFSETDGSLDIDYHHIRGKSNVDILHKIDTSQVNFLTKKLFVYKSPVYAENAEVSQQADSQSRLRLEL